MSDSHIQDENLASQETNHNHIPSPPVEHRSHSGEPRYSREEPRIRQHGVRHRSHKHKQSPRRSFWSRLKKDRRLSGNLLAILAAVVLLFAFVLVARQNAEQMITPERQSSPKTMRLVDDDSSVLLSVPHFDKDISLVSPAALAFCNADVKTPVGDLLAPFRDQGRLDISCPVNLSFDIAGLPSGLISPVPSI